MIAMTGDLAFSGSESQYLTGWLFLDEIRRELGLAVTCRAGADCVPVDIIAIPGNHDCDFSVTSKLRDIVVDGVLANRQTAFERPIVDTCTSVQSTFFQALESFCTMGPGAALENYPSRLAYQYRISVGASHVRALCFNIAWLSRLHEGQGSLFIPEETVPIERDPSDDLVIALFHHPYNWMESNAARAFRKRVEAIADIILTGHEHDSTSRSQQVSTGERNLYVEAGALQESHDPSRSAFNCLVIDIGNCRQKLARYEWEGSTYTLLGTRSKSGDAFGLEWEDYQVTRLKQRGAFEVSEFFRKELEDPGATLIHRARGILKHADVFVYPDLQEIEQRSYDSGRLVRGNSVTDLLINSNRLVVLGDSESGKSSLCKQAFVDLMSAGFIPVIISGSKSAPLGNHLHGWIVNQFETQFAPGATENYRRLDTSRRVLLVDDFHKLELNPMQRREFIKGVTDFAGKVFIFSNTLEQEANDLFDPKSRPDYIVPFNTYRILPFGHARRNELVEKWLLLDEASSVDRAKFAYRRDELTRVLDDLTGKNFLPPHPIFILSVLMSTDALTPLDSRISTYGAYYELFIRTALARGRSPVQSSVVLNYLANLAHQMFQMECREVSKESFQTIHREFEQRFEISRNATSLASDLEECGILLSNGDGIRFRHNYVYYYFCASWLRDHITEPDVRSIISTFARRLHMESYSNILLFLVHLSKDPYILSELLTAARDIHVDLEPSKFDEDVKFLLNFGLGDAKSTYVETDIEENRRMLLEAADEHEAGLNGRSDEDEFVNLDSGVEPNGESDPVIEIVAACKTIEILGQILKNFPGSLEGDLKLAIAKECYSLGLRSLASFFDSLQDVQMDVVQVTMDNIKKSQPKLTKLQAEQRARDFIGRIAEALASVFVRFVSNAVGSSELTQTYRRLAQEIKYPSYLVINANVAIDTNVEFPHVAIVELSRGLEGFAFAKSVLSILVVTHFHLFPVPFEIKQKVYASLGVQYSPAMGANPTRRMVG